MKSEVSDLSASASEYDCELRKFLSEHMRDGLDLSLQGVGFDGHTASLFAGDPALEETDKWCVAAYPQGIPQPRLTLTYPCLNRTKLILVLAAGFEKQDVVKKIFQENDQILPVARLRPIRGKVIWLADEKSSP